MNSFLHSGANRTITFVRYEKEVRAIVDGRRIRNRYQDHDSGLLMFRIELLLLGSFQKSHSFIFFHSLSIFFPFLMVSLSFETLQF